ncbi:MAG: type II toxin-antitoxin system VapC family toxin [Actinomycetales bacterium]|uniref:Ribonuclease VapC n=1 Tax=Candidatus Phosphoribacter hodrii TaxID=2953743 RepID=A0A935M4K4_9MICO|nr:type II toxin-antitoxin system VapC family toxin [Candidatus Phosphoribacter hodrii]HNV13671.1 type II toxin-antitoxin system VapC family toxin [Dermatophilaceae bacterium]MBL0003023.1 type II toxin-antitoxin system VapC family toxin [Candidatus Phosphoribacter hodrii]HOA03425.1 type II toxin-antitoxin system VapC family toxin [Dermatophilaceae bacterium]HOA59694.1 type II toxin-antitoxin system VapC family toxin [Dermatophilaceae bacterium]
MVVVDASIVVRLLQNRRGDAALRERFSRERRLHAPALIDAEVTSALRGLLMTSKVAIRITRERAGEMLDDYADLPIERHLLQPLQRRVLELRDNFTAYDAFYVALAEALDLPLLTDDGKFARSTSQPSLIETWPS